MKRLLVCAGLLLAASATVGEMPFGEVVRAERPYLQDLGFAAFLGPRLAVRDWIVVIAVLAFVAFSMFLWSLPLSQHQLFYITTPLGAVALLAFMRFAPQK